MPQELNDGPIENRSCRDILCCLIFVLFIFGCIVIASLGFTKGNPNLIIYPYDEDGVQCGKEGQPYQYLYFYNTVSNLASVTNATAIAQGVCVTTCPNSYGKLDCRPTKKNPLCDVTAENFYFSTTCNIYLI
jgi:choline transporter-like protein 2/4/5